MSGMAVPAGKGNWLLLLLGFSLLLLLLGWSLFLLRLLRQWLLLLLRWCLLLLLLLQPGLVLLPRLVGSNLLVQLLFVQVLVALA